MAPSPHRAGNLTDDDLPLVHSVSYGNDEKQQTSTAYMLAVNVAIQKLGVRGKLNQS